MGLSYQVAEGTARRGTLYKDTAMKSRVPSSSMLFDCEVEEAPCSTPPLDCDALDSVMAIGTLSCPPIWTLQVAADVKSALRELQQQQDDDEADDRSTSDAGTGPMDANDTCLSLAQALSARGHAVSIRHCLGGGVGGACLRNLRHSFLSYTPPQPNSHKAVNARSSALSCSIGASSMGATTTSSSSATRCIIDPCFREQFEIAHATPRYAAVLEALPAVYVGPEDRMPALVELLCTEMSLAFKAQNVLLPPWRQAKSMLSKWQPRRSLEEHVCFGVRPGSPRACSAGGSSGGGSSGSGRSSSVGSGRVVMEPMQRFVGGDFALVEVMPTPHAA